MFDINAVLNDFIEYLSEETILYSKEGLFIIKPEESSVLFMNPINYVKKKEVSVKLDIDPDIFFSLIKLFNMRLKENIESTTIKDILNNKVYRQINFPKIFNEKVFSLNDIIIQVNNINQLFPKDYLALNMTGTEYLTQDNIQIPYIEIVRVLTRQSNGSPDLVLQLSNNETGNENIDNYNYEMDRIKYALSLDDNGMHLINMDSYIEKKIINISDDYNDIFKIATDHNEKICNALDDYNNKLIAINEQKIELQKDIKKQMDAFKKIEPSIECSTFKF